MTGYEITRVSQNIAGQVGTHRDGMHNFISARKNHRQIYKLRSLVGYVGERRTELAVRSQASLYILIHRLRAIVP